MCFENTILMLKLCFELTILGYVAAESEISYYYYFFFRILL